MHKTTVHTCMWQHPFLLHPCLKVSPAQFFQRTDQGTYPKKVDSGLSSPGRWKVPDSELEGSTKLHSGVGNHTLPCAWHFLLTNPS